MCRQFLIALGGNIPTSKGLPSETLRDSLKMLSENDVGIDAVSRFFQTPCFPPGAGPDYVNAAAAVRFRGGAVALLHLLHEIEAAFGRERVERWGRRTLDLDLIAAGDAVMPDVETFRAWRDLPPDQQTERAPDQLILPHPRMQDRAFVLVPVADVAPGWRHPVLNLTAEQMLSALPESRKSEVVPL